MLFIDKNLSDKIYLFSVCWVNCFNLFCRVLLVVLEDLRERDRYFKV